MCWPHCTRADKKQKVIWKWNLNSILSPYFGQRTSWLKKNVPLWAVLRLSCRFQSSGAPFICTKKNKSMISEVIVGRWTCLLSSYVCSSPQEDYRAINSMITQQIPYSLSDRNKHTLLPAWTCPFRINADSDWRTCSNYPCTVYTLDIYTGLLPSLLHCAGALWNHFQTPRGLECSLKAWNNTTSSWCPVL